LHRCLQRHGISKLPDIEGDKPSKKKFKSYPIGYFHIDIAEVHTQEGRLYLFVAIDRTSKFVYVELHQRATRRIAEAFLKELIKTVPYKIHTILTDNGIQFTDTKGESWITKEIQQFLKTKQLFLCTRFDLVWAKEDIEHHLTKPAHPWTNGQAERMNRTIKEATTKRYHYCSQDQLRQHLYDFVNAYNFAKRLKTLKGLTSYEFIISAWKKEPDRFHQNPLHHTVGLNI
jgi:transposase InsO family protein